jgi:hypothetical protein
VFQARDLLGPCTLLAFMLAAHTLRAAGAPVDRATPEQKHLAQKTFEAADELYEAGRYEEASSAFRGSYEIVASANSLLMVARSERELGHLVEAYEVFQRSLTLAEDGAGRYAETANAIREELAGLREHLGFLVLGRGKLPDGTIVLLDERVVQNSQLAQPIAVIPGKTTISIKTPTGQLSQRALSVAPAQSVEIALQQDGSLAAESDGDKATAPNPVVEQRAAAGPPINAHPSPEPLRSAAFVAGGAGALGLVTFAVFGVLDNATFRDLNKACPDNHCSSDNSANVAKGHRYQLVANVGLSVGILGLAAGATLYALSIGPKHHELTASIGLGRLDVSGRF